MKLKVLFFLRQIIIHIVAIMIVFFIYFYFADQSINFFDFITENFIYFLMYSIIVVLFEVYREFK